MGEKQNLSEAQVWDDSALQAVWNASVKEYQKYHSINARGEDVAEVLKAAAAEAEAAVKVEAIAQNGYGLAEEEEEEEEQDESVDADGDGDGYGDDGEDMLGAPDDVQDENGEYSVPQESGVASAEMSTGQMNGLPMPQAMVAQSTNDEKLKNLMMSWYWAGYYTGLYEGQQQGRTNGTSNGA